jgi:hypothetical protein
MKQPCSRKLPLLAGGLVAIAFLQSVAPRTDAADAPSVRLADQGQASVKLILSPQASERLHKAAETLADYLGRISGARFEIAAGDGTSGIAIGLPEQFPAIDIVAWDHKDPTLREDYRLQSHAKGLYLLGASELAVEHAVWDVLDRLGYRQFFPGEAWQIVPRHSRLEIAVDAREHPSYYARRIWYGGAFWDYNAEPYLQWCQRNRATSGILLNTGHAYDGILSRNRAEFKAHPEYLGLLDGQRKSTKFCISNPGLRKLVVADALRQVEANPALDSVSVDPSDGGGWCQCDECRRLGSPSDRAVTLANAVAEALDTRYGDKFVGMYAYNEHSPPPTVKVHPRVVISVATAFIRGGYTIEELIAGWRQKADLLGIREYYDVHTWTRDMPGAARGSNLDYLKRTIPEFHSQGARFLSAESSDNWGPNGLGYYLAARMLWDVGDAERLGELREDFLIKAFGDAREPMDRFYRLIDGSQRPLVTDDLIGRMARLLAEARKQTDDPAVERRINELVLYTRYVELWSDYSSAQGDARQAAFEALIRHGYRMRKTMMIHAKSLYRDVPARDKSLDVPDEASWQVAEGKNPWKSSAPFSDAELDQMLSGAIERRKLLDFEPVAYSEQLVPVAPLKLPGVRPVSGELMTRGTRNYFTWVEKAPAEIKLQAVAGIVYNNRGAAKLALYPAAETLGAAVAHAAVEPDEQPHSVAMKTEYTGLHRIELADAAAGTRLNWDEGQPMTVRATADEPAVFTGRWNLYFYVPKGTRVIGGYSSAVGTLHDADGKSAFTFSTKPGYFSVAVPPGMDGRLWKFHQCAGERRLMTVPPYLARNERELLLPAEVVEKDRQP